MDNIERRNREMAYISDDSIMEEQKKCRRILQRLNTVDRSDFEEIGKIVEEPLGKSDKAFINPPFYCDYGTHIETGKNFFANYNCTIIDVAKVTIGDNVWIGGNTVILPGVHIGSNTVIGAGSVVSKDIPDWTVAAGNPCRVIRQITEDDKKYYYKDREFDPEAWDYISKLK